MKKSEILHAALGAAGGALGTIAGIVVANSVGKKQVAKNFPENEETFIGVGTVGGIITHVVTNKDQSSVEDELYYLYNGGFDRDTDDARIFNSAGKEVKSLFSDEE